MKLFLTFISLSLFCSFQAQTTGFFGKKNLLEIGGTLQNPMLYNFYAMRNSPKPYLSKDGVLESRTPKLNYGFRFSYGKMIKRNLAVYLETGLNYFSVVPDPYFDYGTLQTESNYTFEQGEMLDIRSFSIIPKIELTSDDGLLPIGITNQFGVGVNFYKTIKKDYIGSADSIDHSSGFSFPVNITSDNYYDYSNQAIKGYTFLYKLTMRIPINDRILYHFGFRYTYTFVPFSNYSTTAEQVLTQANMWEAIRHKESRNLINFETGISFSF